MDRNLVIESAYETIKESLEWGIECDRDVYGYHIDGIVQMTETLLKKLEESEIPDINIGKELEEPEDDDWL